MADKSAPPPAQPTRSPQTTGHPDPNAPGGEWEIVAPPPYDDGIARATSPVTTAASSDIYADTEMLDPDDDFPSDFEHSDLEDLDEPEDPVAARPPSHPYATAQPSPTPPVVHQLPLPPRDDPMASTSHYLSPPPTFDTSVLVPTQVSHAIHGSPTRPAYQPPPSPHVLTKPKPSMFTSTQPAHGSVGAIPMCIICNQRPQFRSGAQSYLTCGTTCGRRLEALQARSPPRQDVMRGHMSNPSSSGRGLYSTAVGFFDNNHYGAGAATTGGMMTRASASAARSPWSSTGGPPQNRMCQVCRVRPRCQRGGKLYPTCGLTCAAKLQPAGTVEMCDYCKQRPKVVLGGRTFPQCGRTCRDKARAAEENNNNASCNSCIMCWKAYKKGSSTDFCSDICKNAANHKAPFLLEIPRGHVSFKEVSRAFSAEWKNPRASCPSVKKIYMVVMKPTHSPKYLEYGKKVAPHGYFGKNKSNEQRRWLGTPSQCGFGSAGNMEPCGSHTCTICTVVRSAYSRTKSPDGVMTTSLGRAVEFAQGGGAKGRHAKMVVMTQVHLGKVVEMAGFEMLPPLPPQGCDSVKIVNYTSNSQKIDRDEIAVFDADALKPLYMIQIA